MRWLVAAAILWLLVGPRLDLPVASLRVEDLVLAGLAAVCLLHVRRIGRPSPIALGVAGVVVTGLISSVVSSARGLTSLTSGMLFALRPLEYFVVLPAVVLLLSGPEGAWQARLTRLLAVVTVLQTAFAVAQFSFGLPIGFSHAAYTRAAGLTVGPYELGAIGAALLVFWVSRGRWVLASLAALSVTSSVSRVSLLGAAAGVGLLVAVLAVRLAVRVRRQGLRATLAPRGVTARRVGTQLGSIGVAAFVLAFAGGLVQLPSATEAPPAAVQDPGPAAPVETPTPTVAPSDAGGAAHGGDGDGGGAAGKVAERIEATSILGSWQVAAALAHNVGHVGDSAQYADIAYAHLNDYVNMSGAGDGEASNVVRFFRWNLILDSIDDPVDVALGLGPSWVGPSVDGSYLRMFADGGVLGVLAWAALIATWLWRRRLWMVAVTASLLVGATFIDILYAERPMVLFWTLLAMAVAQGRRAEEAGAGEPDRPALVVMPRPSARAATAPAPQGVHHR